MRSKVRLTNDDNRLQAHNIVFAQITAGLNFDQLQIDLSRILKAVSRAARNIDRLVFVQQFNLVADRHPRRPAHHNPVFRTVDGALAVTIGRLA